MERLCEAYTKISLTFAQLDTDQDGSISEAEFELGLRRHLHLSDQDVVAIFHLIDNDNDGSVSYAEYTNFMRKIDAAVDEKTNSAHFMNPDQNWKRHQKVWVSRSITSVFILVSGQLVVTWNSFDPRVMLHHIEEVFTTKRIYMLSRRRKVSRTSKEFLREASRYKSDKSRTSSVRCTR